MNNTLKSQNLTGYCNRARQDVESALLSVFNQVEI